MTSTRAVQRAERERAHLPTVALAGYTNAGKSTLLNALTGAEVGVRDRLFHTLDPTTRTLRLDGRTYLMTDTVGFIRKLPHQLVDAFGATLEETAPAPTSLLHVVDASADEEELVAMTRRSTTCWRRSAPATAPRLLVLNKADALDDERRHELAFRHPDAVLVSALTGEGLERAAASGSPPSSSARCATSSCSCRSPRAARCPSCTTSPATSSARTRPSGVRVSARLPAVVAERFDRYAVNGPNGARPSVTRPEEPKPAAPRSVSGELRPRPASSGAQYGTSRSCAIRSPVATANGSAPALCEDDPHLAAVVRVDQARAR